MTFPPFLVCALLSSYVWQERFVYRTVAEFLEAVDLMASNALLFNGPSHPVTIEAQAVARIVQEEVCLSTLPPSSFAPLFANTHTHARAHAHPRSAQRERESARARVWHDTMSLPGPCSLRVCDLSIDLATL